ncbi:hypothetical protein DMC30DRAFT_4434 [Rhodotorula diobovata]|uniref:Uncharacterized protein n=1 Tax=Rhodotorula diobovata TaxID=5288 RepID=A0A5C5G721_9BASI|nr:hypothetical protein DMC30DRAFT_4434 [Rhodotorula diobovata]
MPRSVHPYGVQGDADLPPRDELHDRLTTRLAYAQFKLTHERVAHSLVELENLYLRPFQAQALARAQARRNDEQRQRWREAALRADEARERDGSAYLPPPFDGVNEAAEEEQAPEPRPSAVKLGKRRAVDQDAPATEARDPSPSRSRRQPRSSVATAPAASSSKGGGKARRFLVRFQDLPPTLDMNAAVVHEQAHWVTPPSVAAAQDDDDGDEIMSVAPDVEGDRRRPRTSSSEGAATVADPPPVLANPRNRPAVIEAPSISRDLRFSPPQAGPSAASSLQRSNGASPTAASSFPPGASPLTNLSPPSTSTRASHAAPPVNALGPSPFSSAAATRRTKHGAAASSPYSAGASATSSNATLAPASAGGPHSSPPTGIPSSLSFSAAPPAAPPSAGAASSSTRAHAPQRTDGSKRLRVATGSGSGGGGGGGSGVRPSLGPHASFSALPPPPPLPFDSQPDDDAAAWGGGTKGLTGAPSWVGGGGSSQGHTQGQGTSRAGLLPLEVRAAASALFDDPGSGHDDEEDAGGSDEDVQSLLERRATNGHTDADADADADGQRSRALSPPGSDDERMPGVEEDEDEDERNGADVDQGDDDNVEAGRYPPLSQETVVDSQEYNVEEGEDRTQE